MSETIDEFYKVACCPGGRTLPQELGPIRQRDNAVRCWSLSLTTGLPQAAGAPDAPWLYQRVEAGMRRSTEVLADFDLLRYRSFLVDFITQVAPPSVLNKTYTHKYVYVMYIYIHIHTYAH